MRSQLSYLAAGAFWIATGVLAAETPAVQMPATQAPAAASPAANDPAQPPGAPDDPVICRKEAPLGSRIATIKTCLKRSEWQAKSRSRGRKMDDPSQDLCGTDSCGSAPLPSSSG